MVRETIYDPVFDAQAHYRLLLDAMARPGTINTLPGIPLAPPRGLSRAAALTGFALLDVNVSFAVDGGDVAVTRYLAVNTSSGPEEIPEADFVFAGGMASPSLLFAMKKGTLPYPEEGATLVATVEALASDAQALTRDAQAADMPGDEKPVLSLTLKGPGIAAETTLFVGGLSVSLLEALQECNAEFPLGIDLVLADAGNRIACIPRSSRVRWKKSTVEPWDM